MKGVFLPSSSQVGKSVDSSQMLHEDDTRGTEWWREGDVESPVAIEESGCGPVQL